MLLIPGRGAAGGTRKGVHGTSHHEDVVTKLLLTALLLLVATFLQKSLPVRSEITKLRKSWTQVGTRHKVWT